MGSNKYTLAEKILPTQSARARARVYYSFLNFFFSRVYTMILCMRTTRMNECTSNRERLFSSIPPSHVLYLEYEVLFVCKIEFRQRELFSSFFSLKSSL